MKESVNSIGNFFINRMRDVLFPEGTSNHFEHSGCGLDWMRDRLNRFTSYGRDALGRTTSVTDPQNHLVEFRYNGANQITNPIMHVSGRTRAKHFDYTSTKTALFTMGIRLLRCANDCEETSAFSHRITARFVLAQAGFCW